MAKDIDQWATATKRVISKNKENPSSVIINISGQRFVTSTTTLLKYPDTRLGKLVQQPLNATAFTFEGDAEIFKEVLKFYITGDLHCPKNVCMSDFKNHLEFWGIDEKYISECCSGELAEERELEKQFKMFERRIQVTGPLHGYRRVRYNIWCFLTDPFGPDTKWKAASKIWAIFYFLVMVSSSVYIVLYSINDLWQNGRLQENDSIDFSALNDTEFCIWYTNRQFSLTGILMSTLNLVITFFFVTEIFIRFISCLDKKFFFKSTNSLDFFISILEVFSFVYQSMLDYHAIGRNPLDEINPVVSYWLVMVTMTTVGFGDIYPTTIASYIVLVVVMVVGLMVTALPVAIIGGNFTLVYEYNDKRNKRLRALEDRADNSSADNSVSTSLTDVDNDLDEVIVIN
ncbi:hypothetical protein EB796_019052 [Bugula neritina]|uniref:KCNC1 n=2 Tax=Bugula neritina TaxID=10212 RepID=A0A7J7J8S2_BUGNE|nr:hypothetical protein EB796_019052 [Bugula neritina]